MKVVNHLLSLFQIVNCDKRQIQENVSFYSSFIPAGENNYNDAAKL